MEKIFISTAFFLGFAGSLHCFSMCSPISIIMLTEKKISFKILLNNLLYQIGRLTSYIILGILFSFLGKSFSLIGLHKIISLLLGLFIILYIFYFKLYINIRFINIFYIKFINFFQKKLICFLKKKNLFSAFLIGILNGLLPCGLLYLAITTSISMGDIINGIYFMLFFGIGTIPIMLTSLLLGNIIKINLINNNFIKYITPILLFFMSILLFLRGLGLGIPYISPLDNDLIPAKNLRININNYNCH